MLPEQQPVYLFTQGAGGAKTIINRIAERRQELGMSQTQLAAMLGTGQSVISKYERQDFWKFTLATLIRLSIVLDCELGIKLGDKWI